METKSLKQGDYVKYKRSRNGRTYVGRLSGFGDNWCSVVERFGLIPLEHITLMTDEEIMLYKLSN